MAPGDAYVDFRHHIERLTNSAQSMGQATTLEAKLERLRKAIEVQAPLSMQGFVYLFLLFGVSPWLCGVHIYS